MPIKIDLNNTVALVTGAARGIGRAIALQLVAAGSKIVVNDLNDEDCKQTVDDIRREGSETISIAADVSNKNQVDAMVKQTCERFGGIDILVNNAGAVVRRSALEVTEKEWDSVVDINLKGTFLCSQSVAKQMVDSKRKGKIINVSSILGEVALPPRSAYSASKGGIIALTRDLALEFAQYGINVNSVAPGWVMTEAREPYFAEKGVRDYLIQRIPLGRFCEPSEVASLVTFLASSFADYITGQTIAIDGGWLAI